MNFIPVLFALLIVAVSVATAQPRVEKQRPIAVALLEAESLIEHREYALAIERLDRALDSVPYGSDRSEALFTLARANFLASRYRASLVLNRELLETYPLFLHREESLYMLAVAAHEEDLKKEAEASFRQIAYGGGDRSKESFYWIARIEAERGQLDSAEVHVDRSIGVQTVVIPGAPVRNPASRDSSGLPVDSIQIIPHGFEAEYIPPGTDHEFFYDAVYLSAWIKEGRNELDTAAALYGIIVGDGATLRGPTAPDPSSTGTIDPRKANLMLDAQLRLGVIEARRGNYLSAIRLLNSLTPASTRQREEQLFYLGEASSALGQHDDALRHFTAFVREFPTSNRVRTVRYGTGWSLLQLKRYDEAIATFDGLKEGIDSIAAASSFQIGAIQIRRGDTTQAMASFHSLIERLPYESFSDNAYFQLGKIHYAKQNYDSARHYALIAARQFPESELRAEAYYLLSESYAGLRLYDNAQYSFMRTRKVGASRDLYRRALLRDGQILYKLGRFNSAVDRLREYVAEHPEGADIDAATFWLGEALYQHKAYEEAEIFYSTFVEKFPSSQWREDGYYGLAWSRFQQKKFAEAATAFTTFLDTFPESRHMIEATIRLADSYRYLRQYDRAIATYESIGGRAGEGGRAEEARFRLAQAFYEMGEIERAVATFRALIKYYPNSKLHDVYAYNIGQIYREKEQDSLAIVEMQQFIVTYPESGLLPAAHFTIGDAFYNRQEYDSAFGYYRQVLDKYPASAIVPDALEAVRFSLDAMGRGREAVAVIDSFMARNPNRLAADSITFRKGEILTDQGDFAEAITIYQGLFRDYPESLLRPEALYRIGQNYDNLGRRDSAMILYTTVVDSFPASPAAENALVERGTLALSARMWIAASSDFDLVLTRYPLSARMTEARYGMAAARLQLADTAGALAQYRAVITSDTTGEEDLFVDRSRIMLARLLARAGDRDQGLEILASIVARRRDEIAAEARLLRAELMSGAGDISGALAELKILTTELATYTEFYERGLLMLGGVYEQLTNYTAARETYSKLIAETTDAKMKADAEARLKKVKK